MLRTFTRITASLAVCLVLVAVTGVGVAEYEPPAAVSQGDMLFETKTCFACQGMDAKTLILPEFPKLAGPSAAYALQQITDIKRGARANGKAAAMKGVLHLVNDKEIKVLAEYLSALEP